MYELEGVPTYNTDAVQEFANERNKIERHENMLKQKKEQEELKKNHQKNVIFLIVIIVKKEKKNVEPNIITMNDIKKK